jgi:hypothetical protein
MWSMVQYANALLRNPATRIGLAITVVLSVFLTVPIARRLGWSTFGTGLSIVSLGGAISVTLVNRLWRTGVHWNLDAMSQCLSQASSSPDPIEARLNLVLLLPLGLGLILASRSAVLGISVVVAVAVVLEAVQAVSGLGQCQPSDVLRNAIGGIVGVALGWLILRLLGENAPPWLCPAQRISE